MFKAGKFLVLSSVVSALDLTEEDRELICDTTKNPYPPHRHSAIRWVHIPKTRANFANTIWHYGCNIDPSVTISDFDSRFDFKMNETYPIGDWCPKLVDHSPGSHMPIGEREWACHKGHFVTMMRDPSSRLMQAFHEDQCITDCNPENSRTLGKCDFVKDRSNAACNVLERAHCPADYASSSAAKGCMTKMVLGYPCSANVRLTNKDIDEAVDRVKSGFAFFGLVEEWNVSLCLFHRILGGDFYAIEKHEKPTMTYALPKDCRKKQNEVIQDDIDERVYAEAKRIFEKKVRLTLRRLRGETFEREEVVHNRPAYCFHKQIDRHQ